MPSNAKASTVLKIVSSFPVESRLREHFGSYQEALVLAGLTGILAALMALGIGRRPARVVGAVQSA